MLSQSDPMESAHHDAEWTSKERSEVEWLKTLKQRDFLKVIHNELNTIGLVNQNDYNSKIYCPKLKSW